jgi:hypothetical protein
MEDEMAITGTLCLEKVSKSTLFEDFWCLTPLSIIFQLFRVGKFFTKRQQLLGWRSEMTYIRHSNPHVLQGLKMNMKYITSYYLHHSK